MKSRETLIRLKKFQVDEKRRRVAQIEGMIAERQLPRNRKFTSATRPSVAANDIWKEGCTSASGAIVSTIIAATAYQMLKAKATFNQADYVALGIGMALPYVLLAWFPGWRRCLPAPGPWLVRFKQLLAFPLYATVIWLAWVLGSQRDNDAVLRLLAVLLAAAPGRGWDFSEGRAQPLPG